MKTLRKIIEERKQYITTNKVCYCTYGKVLATYSINELSEEQLNQRYYARDWFIEDGDLCIMNF